MRIYARYAANPEDNALKFAIEFFSKFLKKYTSVSSYEEKDISLSAGFAGSGEVDILGTTLVMDYLMAVVSRISPSDLEWLIDRTVAAHFNAYGRIPIETLFWKKFSKFAIVSMESRIISKSFLLKPVAKWLVRREFERAVRNNLFIAIGQYALLKDDLVIQENAHGA